MVRIYDIEVSGTTKTLERYGVTYKLVNISRQGTQRFYTYQSPGMETIVVVPDFKKQWNEAEKLISKLGKGKSFTAYTQLIRAKIDKNAKVEELSDEDGNEAKGLVARYKDIELELVYNGERLILQKIFIIRDHNVFGENVYVDFREETT